MIDYVDAMLRVWGIAKRKINGRKPIRLKDCLFESGNARSFLGRFREGGHVGKGKGISRLVEPMECLSGDALLTSMAIQLAIQSGTINDSQYELLFVHYVAKASTRRKVKAMGMDRVSYYKAIHETQIRLVGWIAAADTRQKKLIRIIGMDQQPEIA